MTDANHVEILSINCYNYNYYNYYYYYYCYYYTVCHFVWIILTYSP